MFNNPADELLYRHCIQEFRNFTERNFPSDIADNPEDIEVDIHVPLKDFMYIKSLSADMSRLTKGPFVDDGHVMKFGYRGWAGFFPISIYFLPSIPSEFEEES